MVGSYPKRLIEVDLPIKRISAHARREKSIRHGHISTLHIWWARRPLASCRAVICASLWPDPVDPFCPNSFRQTARRLMVKWVKENLKLASQESIGHFVRIQKNPSILTDNLELRNALLNFVADFSNWDNSTSVEYLETSQGLTQSAHEALGGASKTRPLVVDPFAGGGSIPIEALRIGANAFASDLNPIAVLLNKVVLEYIPKYGRGLADEVRSWGEWIKNEAKKELKEYYSKEPDGSMPIAYLWGRAIICEGPGCGARIPMITNPVIGKVKGKKVSIHLVYSHQSCEPEIVLSNELYAKDNTVRRSSLTCPVCGFSTPRKRVELQLRQRKGGADDAILLAVVASSKDENISFRRPIDKDTLLFRKASALRKSVRLLDKELPYLRSIFNVQLYGMTKWAYLYNARQILALSTFASIIGNNFRDAYLAKNTNREMLPAVSTCLSMVLGRAADYWSSLCVWGGSFIAHTFGRQALGMIWDYAEANPFSNSTGNWSGQCDWVARVIDNLSILSSTKTTGNAEMVSATNHILADDIADILVTDPPYYDSVPFGNLSDYFYLWHKVAVGDLHKDLFKTELVNKDEEVVQLAERNPIYANKTKEYFQEMICRSLSEARRYVKRTGLGVVLFAHQGTASWEALLAGTINSGWKITASWPIDTERPGRLRAHNSAVLGSAVHLVCRPREDFEGLSSADNIGDWREILQKLPQRIHEWMPRLAAEGIIGADAIFACIGPALEIFSHYSTVEKASGEAVSLKEYLEQVWAFVAKEALNMIFEGADASGFEEDARLTAMWLWTLATDVSYESDDSEPVEDEESEAEEQGKGKKKVIGGFALEYDAARKIAQGLGAHIENLGHLVVIRGEVAVLLPVAARTRYLFGKDSAEAPKGRPRKKDLQLALGFEGELKHLEEESADWTGELKGQAGHTVLDQLHQSMILFAAGRSDALKRFLVEDGIGQNPLFWRLAQALSALYPKSTNEKRWVDGVLARKKGLGF